MTSTLQDLNKVYTGRQEVTADFQGVNLKYQTNCSLIRTSLVRSHQLTRSDLTTLSRDYRKERRSERKVRSNVDQDDEMVQDFVPKTKIVEPKDGSLEYLRHGECSNLGTKS